MRGTALLIHGGESTLPKLQAALPEGFEVLKVYRPQLSAGYDEVTGFARDYPSVADLLAFAGSRWEPGEPLVVLAFSAGAWTLRHYLRSGTDREEITAAIFLDGLYGAPGGVCGLGPYDGVLAFGDLATAEPMQHRLIMTSSQATPAPAICSAAIAKAVGPSDGVFVVPYAGGDHGAQQSVAGPAAVRDLVTPWLEAGAGPRAGPNALGWAMVATGATLLWLALRRRPAVA